MKYASIYSQTFILTLNKFFYFYVWNIFFCGAIAPCLCTVVASCAGISIHHVHICMYIYGTGLWQTPAVHVWQMFTGILYFIQNSNKNQTGWVSTLRLAKCLLLPLKKTMLSHVIHGHIIYGHINFSFKMLQQIYWLQFVTLPLTARKMIITFCCVFRFILFFSYFILFVWWYRNWWHSCVIRFLFKWQ